MDTAMSRGLAAPSGIAGRHAPYFVQTQFVGSELRGRSRIDVLTQICAGRRPLHVGLQAGAYVITVPDAYSCFSRHFEYAQQDAIFTEVVHPDHNCWYTPHTLRNVIRKYTDWQLDGLWFFNSISLLAIARRNTPSR